MASITNQFFKANVYSARTDFALADQFQNLEILFWKTLKPFETLFLFLHPQTPEAHLQFNQPHG